MIFVIKWCKHQYLKIKEKLGECPTSGGTAFLIKEAMYYEMMICRLNNQFSEYIGDMSVDIVFTNGVLADNYEKMQQMLRNVALMEDLIVEDVESDYEEESGEEYIEDL